jgi:hypothetical protein
LGLTSLSLERQSKSAPVSNRFFWKCYWHRLGETQTMVAPF